MLLAVAAPQVVSVEVRGAPNVRGAGGGIRLGRFSYIGFGITGYDTA